MLSALYLKGVKQGDGQMTVLGLAIAALFYCASRSQPMRRLSATRPPARIFCLQACLSVLGQFAVHLLALLAVTTLCEEHVNPEDPSVMPDGPFRPNIFNSAVFLLSSVMQVGFGRVLVGGGQVGEKELEPQLKLFCCERVLKVHTYTCLLHKLAC